MKNITCAIVTYRLLLSFDHFESVALLTAFFANNRSNFINKFQSSFLLTLELFRDIFAKSNHVREKIFRDSNKLSCSASRSFVCFSLLNMIHCYRCIRGERSTIRGNILID